MQMELQEHKQYGIRIDEHFIQLQHIMVSFTLQDKQMKLVQFYEYQLIQMEPQEQQIEVGSKV